jgi:hypothetical protein
MSEMSMVADLRLVIVRRGHFATFELLTRAFVDDPSVQITWDRRIGERRQAEGRQESSERRRRDRRRMPPAQWSQMNYMIASHQNVIDRHPQQSQ